MNLVKIHLRSKMSKATASRCMRQQLTLCKACRTLSYRSHLSTARILGAFIMSQKVLASFLRRKRACTKSRNLSAAWSNSDRCPTVWWQFWRRRRKPTHSAICCHISRARSSRILPAALASGSRQYLFSWLPRTFDSSLINKSASPACWTGSKRCYSFNWIDFQRVTFSLMTKNSLLTLPRSTLKRTKSFAYSLGQSMRSS